MTGALSRYSTVLVQSHAPATLYTSFGHICFSAAITRSTSEKIISAALLILAFIDSLILPRGHLNR